MNPDPAAGEPLIGREDYLDLRIPIRSERPLADAAPAKALSLVMYVRDGLKEQGAPREYLDEFLHLATSGDYNHLVRTCMNYTEEEFWTTDD